MKKRRTRDIVIELTSLLDVVMILIFAVMIENSKMVKASEAEAAAANEAVLEMRNELNETVLEMQNELKETEEEMQNRLDEAEAEKSRITDEFLGQLQERNERIKEAEEDYARLSEEKDANDKELAIAKRKLAEGEVDELINRIANAERKLEGYEYLSKMVAVYNVGVESIYAVDDPDNELYRILTFGKAGTSDEDRLFEFRNKAERSEGIGHMNTYLTSKLDEVLKDETAVAFVIFTYHTINSRGLDRVAVEEALNELVDKYTGTGLRYSVNIIDDEDKTEDR